MGFFDTVEKIKKVGKEVFVNLANEINEKPQFYRYVDELLIEITAVKKKLDLEPEMTAALNDLRTSLSAAMKKFDKETQAVYSLTGSGMPAAKYNKAFHEFCETSVNAIHQHQSTLMAAPGIWNKLKAFINNVLEEYLDIKDALAVTKSTIATSGEFQSRFDNVKSEGKDKMEEIKERPLSPSIR